MKLNKEDWKQLQKLVDFQDRREVTWEKAVLTLLKRIEDLESKLKDKVE